MAVDNAPRFAFDISITDLLNAVSAISWHTALLALVSALPLAILLNVVWQLVSRVYLERLHGLTFA